MFYNPRQPHPRAAALRMRLPTTKDGPAVTRLFDPPPPIQVQFNTQGDLTHFTLHGRSHRLARLEQRWEVDTDWWKPSGRIHRKYFAVLCTDGLFCVLFEEMEGAGGWFLSKVYD